MNKEIRWKQRFQNFIKANQLLKEAIAINEPSDAEQAGIIQFFEMSFELSWKLMKDYLESEGFVVKSPRECVKEAFQAEIISDGHIWMEALEARNQTVHTYDKKIAEEVVNNIIHKYYPVINDLQNYLEKQLEE
ncbi:MAG: nucleotidyltransferase substrate binding protein [Bacteroidia bacterium]|nr:nucleotidyltransferase substrate binding protein [Bacteroidia bacterium]